jgi:hypothetical protein
VAGPAPFVVPAADASITATVSTARIIIGGFTVGNNLEQQIPIILGAPPQSDLTISLTVTNGPIRLSANGTDAGSTSINVVIPAGTPSGSFFVYGLGSTGSATITASASGYVSTPATGSVIQSGVVIGGPNGAGTGITATAGGTQAVNIQTVALAPGSPIPQALAGGLTLTANLSSSNTAVGTVPTSASITGGSDTGTVQFTAKAAGSTTLSVAQPAGYTSPGQSFTSITAQVQ